ncbi:MAG: hypothetical protein ACHQIM_21830 [Sphingobacteriales bacterium]
MEISRPSVVIVKWNKTDKLKCRKMQPGNNNNNPHTESNRIQPVIFNDCLNIPKEFVSKIPCFFESSILFDLIVWTELLPKREILFIMVKNGKRSAKNARIKKTAYK